MIAEIDVALGECDEEEEEVDISEVGSTLVRGIGFTVVKDVHEASHLVRVLDLEFSVCSLGFGVRCYARSRPLCPDNGTDIQTKMFSA